MKKTNHGGIEYTCSYNGGFYVTTDLKLTGRGVKLSGDGSAHARGKKTYHLTEAAMKKLKANTFVCSMLKYYSHND